MAYYSPTESFNAVKRRIEKSVASYFPLKGVKHTLHAKRVWVDDNKTPDDLKDQKSSKTRGRSWAVPIKAEMELINNRTGKVVDQRTLSLAQLPKTTRRNSYIVDGNEYQVTNLFRRKPGVYTREKANGDLVSEWNLSKGKNFKIGFDPKSKKLTMAVGNANIPLYSVMKAIGVDDDTLERRWGKEILGANRVKNVRTGQQSYYRAMTGEKPESTADAVNLIASTLEKSALDPETTKVTLGTAHERVTRAALLDGTRKLLDVSRGKAQMDDRDSLKFKELGSVEDLLGTRLDHWRVQKDVVRKLTNSLDRKTSIRSIISPDTFGGPIKGFFTSSPLAERPTQSNPVEFLTGARKTTLLAPGEGGIQSTYEIPLEAKSINPSQLGFLDPNHTPESKKTGVTLQLAGSVVKDGRNLKLPVLNVKTGKSELITAAQAASATIAFPDQFSSDLKPLKAVVRAKGADGDIMAVPAAKVDYVYQSSKGMFDIGTNLIPFLQNNQGNRTMVAARQMEQALSLRNREVPLVQVRSDGAKTYEKLLGEYASHIAPADGVVTRVTQDDITLKTPGGLKKVPIYNNFPLNDDRSALNAYPRVKAGDKVVKGQVLADTNYTRGGTLALGTNLNVAYTPWRGYNFEDAVLVSESAAKKLTSQHMFKESVSDEERTQLNKRKFLSYMAGKVTKDQAEKLDDRGVVKPGEIVHKDDILIGALREETVSPEERKLGLISKGFVRPFKPREIRWTHDTPGVVSQVVTSGKNTTVYVKTDRPATIGDKLVGRHGNKGTISEVLPDHEMPHDKDGKPVDILLNQAGIPTRINLGQVLETVAAKVAKKTGKTYKVNNFDPKNLDYTRNMLALMQRYGVSDREELYDPKTKKSLGKVLTGPQYILKLHHMAEKKLSARSRGAYDSNMLPKGGGPEGGQTMDALGLYATLAHNARANVREFQTYKSDKDNDDVWAMIQQGDPPPTPKVPFVFEKFKGYLQGMGLDTVKDGNELILQPLTDAKVRRMSNGALEDAGRAILGKNLKPEKGGIYDEAITGGVDGKKWSHIELPERIPNPVFEKPIRALLGLTGPAYEKIVSGEARLGGKTGPSAIVAALGSINEKKDLKQLEEDAPLLRSTELDKANKKIKYLRAVGKAKMSVKDAYTMKALPVLPPVMRPFTVMDSGDITYDDTTRLYNRMGQVKRQLDSWDPGLPSEEKVKLEYGMYDGVKALMLSGAVHQGKHRNSIAQLIGGGPNRPAKKAFFQDKVIGRRQDLSLRGVISPDPAMSLDEIGLPKKAAMELYKPFVVGHLARRGYPVLEAQELVRRKHPVVDDALKQVVNDRPVLVKRDPVLHKFGVQAFYPRLVGGSSVKIHPLVTGGYNADFDGDSMSAYVPVSPAAVKEARGMVPSANLFNPATGFLVHKPGHESVLGLYKLTEMKGKATRRFATSAAAAAAAAKGEIKLTDPIVVDSLEGDASEFLKTAAAPTRTTLGRIMVYHSLPKGVRDDRVLTDPDFRLDKGGVHNVLGAVAKKSPGDFGTSAEKLKFIGDEYATGKSVGLRDFLSAREARDPYLRAAKEQEIKIRASRLSPKDKDERIVQTYVKAGDLAREAAKKKFDAGTNDMYDWIKSGARGDWTQFSQMTVAPFLVADPSGKPMPIPIGKSYSEGLDIASFMASMHGARMGTIGRAQGTEAPGRLAKHLVRTSMNQVVVSDDCEVAKGVTLPVDDRDVLDRYTAKPIDLGVKAGNKKGIIPPGTVVTPGLLSRLKNNKIDRIEVRSPLRCAHGKGVCAKCYGLTPEGQLPSIGTNLGVIAAHSLSEPAVQLAMNAFHEGGIVGAKGTAASKKFKRVEEILAVPERLRGAAVLSEATGTVSSVKEDKSAGGWRVTVASDSGDKSHYVRGNRTLMVTPGSKVKIGEALTSGPKSPRDVLRLSGVTAVQKYLTDELWDAYESEGPVKRRNIETFVRSMTDLGEVRNPGSHPDFLQGDRVSISSVSEFNRNRPAGAKPVVVKPILQRAEMLPTEVSTDWLARMQTRDLKKTVLDAAAEGWKSMLHGTHPIPGMAYGKEFGKGREPWEY